MVGVRHGGRLLLCAGRAATARAGPRSSQRPRGFTPFGQEHAKDSASPDLKEFYQLGRVDVPDDHPVHAPFGPNLWPDDDVPGFRAVRSELYRQPDRLGATLLRACALYLGEREPPFSELVTESDTILRVIHYPPVPAGAPAGSVRSAAHEGINLITLLPGATGTRCVPGSTVCQGWDTQPPLVGHCPPLSYTPDCTSRC